MALRSRELRLDILPVARLPYRDTGSLHVADQDDEAEVLREFAEIAPHAGYDCEWLLGTRALERSAAIQPQDLEGGPLERH